MDQTIHGEFYGSNEIWDGLWLTLLQIVDNPVNYR